MWAMSCSIQAIVRSIVALNSLDSRVPDPATSRVRCRRDEKVRSLAGGDYVPTYLEISEMMFSHRLISSLSVATSNMVVLKRLSQCAASCENMAAT